MKRRAWSIVILLAALGVAGCSSVPDRPAQKIAGKYMMSGETSTGEAYQGSMELTWRDPGVDVDWRPDPKLAAHGFGLQLDQVLGIVAEDQDPYPGVVLYRVIGGHLEGIWRYAVGTGGIGRENLDGPEGLEGEYKISRGRNPGISGYRGKVTIRKKGDVYLVDWHVGPPGYLGTGVLLGDIFVVGYSEHHRSSVAAYCLRSAAPSEGVTATANDTAYGAEVLWPQAPAAPADAADRLKALRAGGLLGCSGPTAANPS